VLEFWTSFTSARLCAKKGSRVSNSPATSAPSMNTSRALAGSSRPKLTLRRAAITSP
jgi:hypothetical protein